MEVSESIVVQSSTETTTTAVDSKGNGVVPIQESGPVVKGTTPSSASEENEMVELGVSGLAPHSHTELVAEGEQQGDNISQDTSIITAVSKHTHTLSLSLKINQLLCIYKLVCVM